MPITYDCIASTTVASATNSVTFSSISSSYTDLVIVMVTKLTSGTAQILFQFNNDTGSNYGLMRYGTNGSVIASDSPAPTAFGQLSWYGYAGPAFGQSIVAHLNDYSNTTTYKTMLSRNSNADYGTGTVATCWRNNNAINTIKIYSDAADLDVGTRISIYGIKAA